MSKKKLFGKNEVVEEAQIKRILRNKQVPVLTLDVRWHQLLAEEEKTPVIKRLEKELNTLLKEQGQTLADMKDMRKIKGKLMEEILRNMDASEEEADSFKVLKQDKSQQFIKEINEKMKQSDDRLSSLPYRIREINEQLLTETLKICFKKVGKNDQIVKELSEWIPKAEEELKRKRLIRDDREEENDMIYSYMREIMGRDIVSLLDRAKERG